MTCIIGYKCDGKVYLGGDSYAGNLYTYRRVADPKVFRRGDMVFGYTTSFRMGQLIQYNLTIPYHLPDVTLMEYMVTSFVPALREVFKDGGYMTIKDSVEDGGFFLMGYRGELLKIQPDFSVLRSSRDFMAVGCGDTYALGAMGILENLDMPPEDKVLKALESTEAHESNVCGPFHIINT